MLNQKNKLFYKFIILIIFLLVIRQQGSTFAKTKLHDNKLTFARQCFKMSKKDRIILDTTSAAILSAFGPIPLAFGLTELGFTAGPGVKYIQDLKVNFVEDAHCVHSGQPYKGVLSSNSSGLSVLAGRKDSKSVAECFNNWLQGGASTFGHSPSALNFAVKGTLQVSTPGKVSIPGSTIIPYYTFTFKNMILAQGRSGSTNNWWIGDVNCKHKDHGRIACTPEGDDTDKQAVCFNRPKDSVSTIHLVSCKRTY